MKNNPNINRNQESLNNRRLWITNSVWVIIVLIILLFFHKCSSEKNKDISLLKDMKNSLEQANSRLQKQNDSLQDSLDFYQSWKAVLISERKTVNGKRGTNVSISFVGKNEPGKSEMFIPDVVITKKIRIPSNNGFLPELRSIPSTKVSVKDTSKFNPLYITFELYKSNPDSTWTLSSTKLELNSFNEYNLQSLEAKSTVKIKVGSSGYFPFPLPFDLDYYHQFTEYIPNPYREKAEKSFRNGLIFGAISAGLYGISEAVGNPIYTDYGNNSVAKEKSNKILFLRIGSGVFAAASLFEFYQTIHYHNLEGKFIVSPTKVGAKIYLDKKQK
jgi:hypothetical protein